MKQIINRKTGQKLTIEEAKALCSQLKSQTQAIPVEHKCVSGYSSPAIAEKANLRAVLETYEGYTFAYVGTVNDTLEGYKVFVIAIKDLPSNFEMQFPNFVVIG